MKLSRSQLRNLISEEAKKAKLPGHFGSGKNIDVYGYKTKHFEICLSAVNLFEELKKKLKGINLKGIKVQVAEAAKITDKIFAIEKRVVKNNKSTEKDIEAALELNGQFKHAVKKIFAEDAVKKIAYMPMHLKEITKRKEK